MEVDLTIEELSALYALADVPGIGLQRMRTLLRKFVSAQRLLAASRQEIMTTPGIREEVARNIRQAEVTREHLDLARAVKEKDVSVLHFLNYNYPRRLHEIPDGPVLLYTAGEILKDDEQSIAVVGTRSSSSYGHAVTRELTRELVRNNFTIVSGLARGIDTEAHQSALENGGRTIAVLGSGIDTIYPQENMALAREIAYRGCICTEYNLGTPPDAPNFPERNRIISGLSLGTVVIEAGHKSGAILTALLALEQNREVFAVPGRIDSKRSIGTNRLIKHGAKLVQTVDDILEELSGQLQFAQQSVSAAEPVDLTDDEQQIYDLLSEEPVHIDDLAASTEKSTAAILSLLLSMELRSLVKQLPGKQFIRT